MKKNCLLFILLLGFTHLHAQTIEQYFERIRNNTAELTAFFAQMPKGGDLHHHYSGSVYAETYIDYIVSKDYYLSLNTLKVDSTASLDNAKISTLIKAGQWPMYKAKLLEKWSVKDYDGVSYPSDKQFFDTFGYFDIASSQQLDVGLLELKNRAKAENVSYIETMLKTIPLTSALKNINRSYNEKLRQADSLQDEVLLTKILDSLYATIIDSGAVACADTFNQTIEALHKKALIDDGSFKMRYMNYATRIKQPLDVFRSLVLSFISASRSKLIVGVNIVAPENDNVSMRDYRLHMLMFKYCHKKYDSVKYSMHAGELVLGMVKPEELNWHIDAAVRMAGASRIGHGVDLPYERNAYDLLRYMASNKIAVEINLYSNEFILKVKDDQHPIRLYYTSKVPIVISTDDAGVLRTNLTEQFVLLAKRYPYISYRDIKSFVYNSIDYSFIKEDEVKEQLKKQLQNSFTAFERKVLANK
ncbi:hypothetical protein QTN47_13400 [Danxiaibacter flavus]|uniref:adenosine deaminase n=1 Tax=Danxiaibacter flavus TaxID=3049108 RepID=A0ABV3ZJ11_9BACT|nr:hypothetical protein QNM32_13405 [Chitinophagaceae bacterium DXS]